MLIPVLSVFIGLAYAVDYGKPTYVDGDPVQFLTAYDTFTRNSFLDPPARSGDQNRFLDFALKSIGGLSTGVVFDYFNSQEDPDLFQYIPINFAQTPQLDGPSLFDSPNTKLQTCLARGACLQSFVTDVQSFRNLTSSQIYWTYLGTIFLNELQSWEGGKGDHKLSINVEKDGNNVHGDQVEMYLSLEIIKGSGIYDWLNTKMGSGKRLIDQVIVDFVVSAGCDDGGLPEDGALRGSWMVVKDGDKVIRLGVSILPGITHGKA